MAAAAFGHGVRRLGPERAPGDVVRFQVVFVSYVVASGGTCGHGRLLLRNEEAKPGCHRGQGPSPSTTSLDRIRPALYVSPDLTYYSREPQ